MMQAMFECGWTGWVGATLMAGAGFVVLLVLLLALAALAKYILGESRRNQRGQA